MLRLCTNYVRRWFPCRKAGGKWKESKDELLDQGTAGMIADGHDTSLPANTILAWTYYTWLRQSQFHDKFTNRSLLRVQMRRKNISDRNFCRFYNYCIFFFFGPFQGNLKATWHDLTIQLTDSQVPQSTLQNTLWKFLCTTKPKWRCMCESRYNKNPLV